jgi:hypothetical protein
MIITKLSGGLGNQMFQYAAARSLALKYHTKLLLDISMFAIDWPNVDKREFALQVFPNIKPEFSTKFLSGSFSMPSRFDNDIRKFIGCKPRKIFTESKHAFNESFDTIKPPVLLDGYWQSEKYFMEYETIIQNDFQFKNLDTHDKNNLILKDILSNNSVSVHIRRGDYVKYGNPNMYKGLCNTFYYQNAIKLFLEKYENIKFYFFSEDPEWVSENILNKEFNSIIVNGNIGSDCWKDMYLMSKCKHHIIANSSFSWWGAWLNSNPDKMIVAPKKWFNTNEPYFEPNNLVPENWIRL